MLRVGIIGCGKIADQHANNIKRTRKAQIVAACDIEPLMSKQFTERFTIPHYYSDVDVMLDSENIDVIHITTPPFNHLSLAKLAIEANCHVYVEKPFAIDTNETLELIKTAEYHNKLITVGHNLQFSHIAMRMRKLINHGYIGGNPIHMESYYCYDLSNPKYAKAILGDTDHWVRNLPGKLLHNLISHGISKIAEYLFDPNPDIVAVGFPSQTLKRINEDHIIDEVRIIISSSNGTTANFICSTQMKPTLRAFTIYGQANGIHINEDQQLLFKIPGNHYRSFLNQFLPQLNYTKQSISNLGINFRHFLRNDFHPDHGMKNLIDSFYSAIIFNDPPPIPYDQIVLVSRILDESFKQLNF